MPDRQWTELQYVICYDISDDTRRQRMATALLDYGHRIQESVFVANLEGELLDRMKQRVEKIMDTEADAVHIFAICAGCAKKAERLGISGTTEDPTVYIV